LGRVFGARVGASGGLGWASLGGRGFLGWPGLVFVPMPGGRGLWALGAWLSRIRLAHMAMLVAIVSGISIYTSLISSFKTNS